MKYFYNKVTKKSQWQKPECLRSEEEKLNDTEWQEFKTKNGKIFYFSLKNKKIKWKVPEELQEI